MPNVSQLTNLVKRRVAHRWDIGWYDGIVMRQITMSDVVSNNGKYEVKYVCDGSRRNHTLLVEDYGCEKHWVLINS